MPVGPDVGIYSQEIADGLLAVIWWDVPPAGVRISGV
jgi:hypothetical protein